MYSDEREWLGSSRFRAEKAKEASRGPLGKGVDGGE